MPTKIETLWELLEADLTAPSGLLLRRYDAALKPDVFAAVRRNAGDRQRVLAVSLPAPVAVNSLTVHDLALTVEKDTARAGRQVVLLTLTNAAYSDLFAVVCEDLIGQLADEAEPQLVLRALLNRLEQWTALFEGVSPDGLSAEKRQGLFGELWFLSQWLGAGSNPAHCLTAWTGPTGSIHDFQLPNQAVEIKTTSAVNPQAIQISNERQLDNSGLTNLWLWLITLDSRPTGGQSLNNMVDGLLVRLGNSPTLQNTFRLRLYQVGYQPLHRALYDTPTYAVRQEQVFSVSAGFPCLRMGDLPTGVSTVRYAVALAACQPFIVEPESVLAQIQPLN
ncbi:MAG: PD-(D/E)XK motif protein [Rudanella sp.]|nr:PD-(D/E)XK motif protein [Rudanella sp.]